MTYRNRSLYIAACFVAACMSVAASAEPLTAAILGWSVDDDHYVSHREAAQLTDWLEAELSADEQYRWVDRATLEATREELSLAAAGGIADPATWLRVGLWVQADLIVTGRAESKSDGWTLTGQVIDVERADVLVSWETKIPGEDKKPLDLAGLDIAAWLSAAQQAVGEAKAIYDASRTQVAVAVLQFENTTDVGRRLDHLEYKLERVLPEAFKQDARLRLLRFPGAPQATAEHELVLSGLAADRDGAPRRIADAYVWGQYREVDWQGVPFRKVKVEFTLHLWDGNGPPIERVFHGLAGEQPALLKDVIETILEWAGQQTADNTAAHNTEIARQISQTLQARATRLQAINRGNEWDVTNGFRHRWRRTVRLLEIAYFFDAENADLHRELLAERYRDDLSYLNRVLYGEPWRRSALDAEIQHHVDRFGFDVTWPTSFRTPSGGSLTDNRFPHGGKMSVAALHSLNRPLRGGTGLRETPRDIRKQEIERYQKLAIRRAHAALEAHPDLDTLKAALGLELADGAKTKADLLEHFWPKLDLQVQRNQHKWQAQLIRKTLGAAGRETEAQAYIDQLEIVDPPRRARRDPDTLPSDTGPFSDNMDFLPRLTQLTAPTDGWPPLLEAEVRPFKLPGFSYYEFPQMWRHGESLWINVLLESHRRRTSELNIWRYTPADEKWHGTTGWIRTNRRVTKALPSPAFDPDSVWLATEGHSVGRLDATTGESKVYGPLVGLTSTRFRDAVTTRDRLIFGGGERGEHGQLNMYLPASEDWVAFAVPTDLYDGALIERLTATDETVLVAGTHWGSSPILLRFDLASGAWTPMRSQWLDHVRQAEDTQELRPQPRTDRLNPDVLYRDPDGKTLWLGSPFGLTRYRPAEDTMDTWFARPPAHPDDPPSDGEPPVRLFGVISAIEALPDGRHLVVATDSHQSRRGLGGSNIGHYLFVFDKQTEQWVGYLPLPFSGYARVRQLLAHESELWLSTTRGNVEVRVLDLDALGLPTP
ncbi:hypothetical protein [Algisphaera agarilytica]|uniref:Uncharacterized protein n=1 Tax=Algisphaera agarilytica TaxID=1385975 RepID=A0A7X0LLI7_9BACT|nr:hypothetical protein [Algisphaera agarilytica]MBB6430681.1 hypothetical protein [Algisphaera agarilytica]